MFAKINKEFCKCKRIMDFFKVITKFPNFLRCFFFLKIMEILMFATILEISASILVGEVKTTMSFYSF